MHTQTTHTSAYELARAYGLARAHLSAHARMHVARTLVNGGQRRTVVLIGSHPFTVVHSASTSGPPHHCTRAFLPTVPGTAASMAPAISISPHLRSVGPMRVSESVKTVHSNDELYFERGHTTLFRTLCGIRFHFRKQAKKTKTKRTPPAT